MSAGPGSPDWADASHYAWLFETDRSAFAWEWLRRNRPYQDAAIGRSPDDARIWGLHRFEDPAEPFPIARPVWTSERHDWVVTAQAHRAGDQDRDVLDLARLGRFAKSIDDEGVARLLLSDGYRSIRLDISGAPPASGRLALSYSIYGIRRLLKPLTVLGRLRSLAMTGRFAQSLYPSAQRSRRLVLLLRAFDALEAGATHADLAYMLLAGNFERESWRIRSPSLRSRAQRLAREARRMAAGGFWTLLQ